MVVTGRVDGSRALLHYSEIIRSRTEMKTNFSEIDSDISKLPYINQTTKNQHYQANSHKNRPHLFA